jgi:hypothetical protein
MLDRRLALAEERAEELEELVDVMRAQRDRLQTCYEQKDRADGLDAATAAVRDAAGELLAASDRQIHAALGPRGLARAKVEYADALAGLRRALERNAGKGFLAPVVVDDVRRFFTSEILPPKRRRSSRRASVGRSVRATSCGFANRVGSWDCRALPGLLLGARRAVRRRCAVQAEPGSPTHLPGSGGYLPRVPARVR